MKFLLLVSLFFYGVSTVNGQDYYATDQIALNIPYSQTYTTTDIAAYINNHFNIDSKKVRAIYVWVASNIRYDKDSIYRTSFNEGHYDKITTALRKKKGVCENYAAIFNDICIKCGIKSFVIEGYTRQNSFVNKSGHVWCSAFVNDRWFLYDPTWDAGYVNDGSIVNQIRNNYFQVSPSDFIQTHMPFDPLFQFLNYPVSYKEFSNGNAFPNNHKTYFNYMDSIASYEKQDSLEQYNASILRIENTGAPVPFIDTKLKQLKMEKEIIYQDKDVDLYNAAVADYKTAIGEFKAFLDYRNNQFLPAKSNDEIEAMLESVDKKIVTAKLKLNKVDDSKATLVLNTGDVEKMLDDLSIHVTEQRAFIRSYFGTAKGK